MEVTAEAPLLYRYYDTGAKAFKTGGAFDHTWITDQTTWQEGWYAVDGEVELNARVQVSGEVRLILTKGAKLTVNGGIHAVGSNNLTIYAHTGGTGALVITGVAGDKAGIGGDYEASGIITIHGGNVTAQGGDYGAGIGGGISGEGGSVIVYGGTVNAGGGEYSAGIGGGQDGGVQQGGGLTVHGGKVYAASCGAAMGIGCGSNENGYSLSDGDLIVDAGLFVYGGDDAAHSHCIRLFGEDKEYGRAPYMEVNDTPAYEVQFTMSIVNGIVIATPAWAKAGKVIALRCEPADDYSVSEVTVTYVDAQTGETEYVDVGDDYTFEMPAATATVDVTFAQPIHDDITFKHWKQGDAMPTEAGDYVLMTDVTLTETREVPTGTVNLCLNGHTITLNGDDEIISVGNGATLNIFDCKEDCGTIAHGEDCLGHGINLTRGGSVTLNNGVIVGTEGFDGVRNYGGIFTMNGGKITGAEYGVDNANSKTTFVITGGEITGNDKGVRVILGTMKASGKPVIQNNTSANVYLYTGRLIEVTGALDADARIGVSRPGNSGVITSGLKDKGTRENFTSGSEDHAIYANDDGEAAFTGRARTVTFMPDNGDDDWQTPAEFDQPLEAPEAPTKSYYKFLGWYDSETETLFDFETRITSDLTLIAYWGKYDITIADTIEHGTIEADATSQYADQAVTLTAQPDEGYALDTITVDDGDETTDPIYPELQQDGKWTFQMPDADVTVTATFKPAYKLILNATAGGSLPTCNVSDPDAILKGTRVTLTASEPQTGYAFAAWYNGSGQAVETAKILSFTMTGDATFTARYQKLNSVEIEVVYEEDVRKLRFTPSATLPAGATVVKIGVYATAPTSDKFNGSGQLTHGSRMNA